MEVIIYFRSVICLKFLGLPLLSGFYIVVAVTRPNGINEWLDMRKYTVAQKTAPMFAYFVKTYILLNANIIKNLIKSDKNL